MSPALSRRWTVTSREPQPGGSWGVTTEESIRFKNYVGENLVRSYFRHKGREVLEIEPEPTYVPRNSKR